MRILLAFRATLNNGRGVLSVLLNDDGSWSPRFDADSGWCFTFTDPKLVFTDASGAEASLPSPSDKTCRDLGAVRFMTVQSVVFELRSRLPVTADRASTAVVSLRPRPRARSV